ncbi:MAG: 4-alpha-glucanotransferase [Planctomycetota bacterium]|nr:MAG: 4-alpha-glucanotransferase [Planctomycetota bacterium]
MAKRDRAELYRLARLYGVQTAYRRTDGTACSAGPEALLRVLQVLGAPLERAGEAGAALRARRLQLWRRVVEPVVVLWQGAPPQVRLRLPARPEQGTLRVAVRDEQGQERAWRLPVRPQLDGRMRELEGERFVRARLRLPEPPPPGVHRLRIEAGGNAHEATLLVAPPQAFQSAPAERAWGVYVPAWALHSERSAGCGDVADLQALAGWLAGHGGKVLGTLPLLAAFLEQPCEPSPYVPASRLFWNELYLALERVPELEASAAARALLGSPEGLREQAALRAGEFVEHARIHAFKRRVLQALLQGLETGPAARREAFAAYVAAQPRLAEYARFRGAMALRPEGWPHWPARLREGGALEPADADPAVERLHLYAQWLMHEQLSELRARLAAQGQQLYLDLPLGVHGLGYDVWRFRGAFALGVAAGAPPDALGPGGQCWGFAPLHPERSRLDGHAYLRACLVHQMQVAGMLRLDHVMGLYRMFWVPDGMPASQGVYVRYPAEELFALVCLESARHRTLLVGENLGTVPQAVEQALVRHGIARMYVLPFALRARPPAAAGPEGPAPPAREVVASLNTHDMPPFAAWVQGLDLEQRRALGLLEPAQAAAQRAARAAAVRRLASWLVAQGLAEPAALRPLLEGPPEQAPGAGCLQALLAGCVRWLGASEARWVLLNLEDLWLETRPQNVPGTGAECPNWRRRAQPALEQLGALPAAAELLALLARARGG